MLYEVKQVHSTAVLWLFLLKSEKH